MDDDYLNWTDHSMVYRDDQPAEKITNNISMEEARHTVHDILSSEKPTLGRIAKFMMEEVATGLAPNPFIKSPLEENSLRLLLDQFIKYHTAMALQKLTGIKSDIPTDWKDSITRLEAINKEICCAIQYIGGFSIELTRCWRSHCRKFFVRDKHFTATVGSDHFVTTDEELSGDDKRLCMANDCEMDDNENYFYHIVFEAGMYNDELEYIEVPEKRKIISFCRDHMIFFELFFLLAHMRWNVYLNCKNMIEKIMPELNDVSSYIQIHAKIPLEFYKQLTIFYMARYNMIWCFGKPSDWKTRGFGMTNWLDEYYKEYSSRGKSKLEANELSKTL